MKSRTEFHAHNMPEEFCAAVLYAAAESDLIVGALLIDKAATRTVYKHRALPSPNEVQEAAPVRLLEAMVRVHEYSEIRFDEEIEGKRRQQVIITAVKRVHRAAWPQARIRVRPSPSHKSDLIQVADATAYSLGRYTRDAIRTERLRQRVEILMAHEAHMIIGPREWAW
jgi:hypothetical protein